MRVIVGHCERRLEGIVAFDPSVELTVGDNFTCQPNDVISAGHSGRHVDADHIVVIVWIVEAIGHEGD